MAIFCSARSSISHPDLILIRQQLWHDFDTTLTNIWHNCDTTLRQHWHIFETTLRRIWRNLGLLWENFENFGTSLGPHSEYLVPIGSLFLPYGNHMAIFSSTRRSFSQPDPRWPHGNINGDHLAPLGNSKDNTWAPLGTTYSQFWDDCATSVPQLWDNFDTKWDNFDTSLWYNFGRTFGQLWDNMVTT